MVTHGDRQDGRVMILCALRGAQNRHELFDDAFQGQLESMYRTTGAGDPPHPPATLLREKDPALATSVHEKICSTSGARPQFKTSKRPSDWSCRQHKMLKSFLLQHVNGFQRVKISVVADGGGHNVPSAIVVKSTSRRVCRAARARPGVNSPRDRPTDPPPADRGPI
jgi:hypothetical protein